MGGPAKWRKERCPRKTADPTPLPADRGCLFVLDALRIVNSITCDVRLWSEATLCLKDQR